MSPTALVRAVASLTSISVSTEAGSFNARFDEQSKRVKIETELFDTRAKDEYTLSAAGGFAITSAAAVLSRASKLLGASSDERGALVRVTVFESDKHSDFEFRLPLRTSSLRQLKTFFNEIQTAHSQIRERARKGNV